jgi:hypothetical protein
MGEARRRGTFEERREAAIERAQRVEAEAQIAFERWQAQQAAKKVVADGSTLKIG